MDLRQSVLHYYWENFTELPTSKQFHFASRLSLWLHDERSKTALANLEQSFTSASRSDERAAIAALLAEKPHTQTINGGTLRAEFFAAYPNLYGLSLAMFRIRHLLIHYGQDHRDILLDLVPRQEITALRDSLLADPRAISILSTYAVNFLYLGSHLEILPALDKRHINMIIGLESSYHKKDRTQFQLYIYLFTHCIIADTNFYVHRADDINRRLYMTMINLLTQDITKNYTLTTLDTRLEYLVCCKILGIQSSLATQIIDDASQNISSTGTFLVDPFYPLDHPKNSFSGAEHRNVLFIMSGSSYNPED